MPLPRRGVSKCAGLMPKVELRPCSSRQRENRCCSTPDIRATAIVMQSEFMRQHRRPASASSISISPITLKKNRRTIGIRSSQPEGWREGQPLSVGHRVDDEINTHEVGMAGEFYGI